MASNHRIVLLQFETLRYLRNHIVAQLHARNQNKHLLSAKFS